MTFSVQTKIRSKLFTIIFASLFVSLLIVGILLNFQITKYLQQQVYVELEKLTDFLAINIRTQSFTMENSANLRDRALDISRKLHLRVTFIDARGNPIADSHIPQTQLPKIGNLLTRPEIQAAIRNGRGYSFRLSATTNKRMFFYAKSFSSPHHLVGFIRLASSASEIQHELKSIRRMMFLGAFLILLMTIISGFFYIRSLDDNFKELLQKLKLLAAGDTDTIIKIRSNDELSQIAELINKVVRHFTHNLKELSHDKEELNTILSSISEGLLAVDENKKIIFFNKIFLQMFKNLHPGIINEYYYDVIRQPHLLSLIDLFFEKPYIIRDEMELGDDRFMEVIISPLKTRRQMSGCVVVLRDITQNKKLEKIRRDFVANVSHEFKTPLAAIRGYSETLLDWALEDPEISKKYISKIIRQSQQLENLVSDLLELARIEKLQSIELKSFNPLPIIQDLIQQYRETAQEKNISIDLQWEDEEAVIKGEPEMFRSIMANLLDNAIKYTPAGGNVLIFSKRTPDTLIISVKDTGIGIPQKELERIFERFYRVDRARSREAGGTGLGLSIVKHLSEIQQAKVSVESEEGKGSCFSVEFLRGD